MTAKTTITTSAEAYIFLYLIRLAIRRNFRQMIPALSWRESFPLEPLEELLVFLCLILSAIMKRFRVAEIIPSNAPRIIPEKFHPAIALFFPRFPFLPILSDNSRFRTRQGAAENIPSKDFLYCFLFLFFRISILKYKAPFSKTKL
jgi:hypothetical protein